MIKRVTYLNIERMKTKMTDDIATQAIDYINANVSGPHMSAQQVVAMVLKLNFSLMDAKALRLNAEATIHRQTKLTRIDWPATSSLRDEWGVM